MRKVKEILRLYWGTGLSQRQIAISCGISRPTVTEYIRRAEAAGLSWPLPVEMDEAQLEQRLFPRVRPQGAERPQPSWAQIHQELKRKGVTLFLLWQEYKEIYPEGFQYSTFCEYYRLWEGQLDLVMRQPHRAGEKLFLDYAGQTVPVIDRASGEVRPAQIFLAVLGASSYTYVEATWTQSIPDWIASHIHAFEFFQAVPEVLVPDNLKGGVTSPHRYEPDLNPTYQELALHYGVAVVPARVRKPRDKAKVEQAVLLAERWLLARLRHHPFFSLAELNAALHRLLEQLNRHPFKKLPGSRWELFQQLDRPAMCPLPAERYSYAQWLKAKVPIDYHVEVAEHYYSVPYQRVKQELEVRLTAHTVELFHRGVRVTSPVRSAQRGHHTTLTEHMPRAHQAYAEWTPQRLIHWAEQTGPHTAAVVAAILASRPHPQQGFRSCLGLMRLGEAYGKARLEAACQRASALQAYSYKSIASILKQRLDQKPLPENPESSPLRHPNIRGAEYYHGASGEPSC
jgi:transposase